MDKEILNDIRQDADTFSHLKEEADIKNRIYNFRGKKVMVDSDVAECFQVTTKRLNEQMKRNNNRFPSDFCFKLNKEETSQILRSQIATSKSASSKRRYNPYVYTEQGIITLAGVIKSDIAAEMSVRISRAFVSMSKIMLTYEGPLGLIVALQNKVMSIEENTNETFDMIIKRIEKLEPKKEVLLLSGEHFTALEEVIKLIERAKENLVLVDPYADDKSLVFLSHKKPGVKVTIYKSKIAKLRVEEVEAFSKQYGEIKVNEYNNSHNRYLIIDSDEVYDLGTSLNRIGGKDFTMSKMEIKEVRDALIGLFTL